MADNSFDIVSETNMQELTNAVDQTKREINTRYDFKGTKVDIELSKTDITLTGDDENKLKQLIDVLQNKLIKRNLSLKSLIYDSIENASGGIVKQKVTFINGLDGEQIRKINKALKEEKFKIKTQNIDQKIRVSSKSKNELQTVMAFLKKMDLTVPLQFNNYK